jgi:uncharacterized protein
MKKLILVLAMSASMFAASIGNTALVSAAEAKDRAAVKAMLLQKANANSATADGTTALHWAAHWNDLDMTEALLKAGADAKATNRYGVSPIVEAAKYANKALVARLLAAGADANATASTQGETVLMAAARVGNADAVAALLDRGAWADSQEEYRGQTALMWAAGEGHANVVKLLLTKRASVDLKSNDHDTTPHKLPAGTPVAPIPRGGLTALLFAARQGQIEAAQALLDGGADINLTEPDGNSALVLAIMNKHYDFAQMLLDRGANPNVANIKDGRTALYTAVDTWDGDWSPRPDRRDSDKFTGVDIIKSLLAHGANVNAQLTNASPIKKLAQDGGDRTVAEGGTAFMRAARSADLEVMRILLDHHAEPSLANKDGHNALLLAAGVSWGDKIKGNEEQALEAVKLCYELGLDVNSTTNVADTALHGAALRGADSIIKFLVEKGANLDVKNKQGFTPLEIAMGKTPPNTNPRPYRETTVELIKKLSGPTQTASK